MRFVPDRSELPIPGICFVCETAPQAGAVDTLQNFTPGFPTTLAGAKIICEGCLKAAGESFGLFAATDVAEFKRIADEAVGSLSAVREHVSGVAAKLVDEVLIDVGKRAPVVVANAANDPAPKSRAKKADVPEA